MRINGRIVDLAVIDTDNPMALFRDYVESDEVVVSAGLDEIVDVVGRDLPPAVVTDLVGSPGKITAKVHVDRLFALTGAAKTAAKAVGAIRVTVTTELSDATLTVVIAASARGISLSRMVRYLLADVVDELPAGMVSVRTRGRRTMVDVDLAQAVEEFTVTSIEIGDTITVAAERA